MSIDRAELNKISYLDQNAIGDRTVNLLPFWDGVNWQSWLPGPAGSGLIKMQFREMLHADYVAKEPVRKSDLLIPFVEFMWQHASWSEACPIIASISNDIHNLATSVAKIRHFFKERNSLGNGITSAFVTTELEYLLTVARSVFDLLQELISKIWGRVKLLDDEAEKRRKGRMLPDSFSKLVLYDKRALKTKEEIGSEYGLPQSLADAYARHAAFFSQLRDARDKIIHRGASLPIVFVTDKGFCVDPKQPVFRWYDGWKPEHFDNANIASLLPWLSHVVSHTIEACNDLVTSLAVQVQFPPEIAPGYHIFVRGYNNDALIDIMNFLEGGSPWWQEIPPEGESPLPEGVK